MHHTKMVQPHTRHLPVIDSYGFLITTVPVHSMPWHIKHGHVIVEDWRAQWTAGTLAPGAYIMCDDGWISQVKSLDYAPLHPYIELETGRWNLSKDTSATGLYKNHLTGGRFSRGLSYTPALMQDQYLRLHVVARALIAHDFDMDAAAKVAPFSKHMMRSPVFRGILMTEALKWFNQAGVSPADMIQLLYERIKRPDVDVIDLIKAQKLYFALHPDFAYDDSGGRAPRGRQQDSLPPYMGQPIGILDAHIAEDDAPPIAPDGDDLPEPQTMEDQPNDQSDYSNGNAD